VSFERVYCVNLDRRPGKWRRFAEALPGDWPFPPPVRVSAIDGRTVPQPSHWKVGGGAWGCYRSHLRLIEQCLNEGVHSVLLLEDDAVIRDTAFSARVLAFLAAVPTDWQLLYLGGQLLHPKRTPPQRVNEHVYAPGNVHRTHAWALSREGMALVYRWLNTCDWPAKHHIDHRLGLLTERGGIRTYCPARWLIGQNVF